MPSKIVIFSVIISGIIYMNEFAMDKSTMQLSGDKNTAKANDTDLSNSSIQAKKINQDILQTCINRRRDQFHSSGRHVSRRLEGFHYIMYTPYDIFLSNLNNNLKKKLITYHKNSDI